MLAAVYRVYTASLENFQQLYVAMKVLGDAANGVASESRLLDLERLVYRRWVVGWLEVGNWVSVRAQEDEVFRIGEERHPRTWVFEISTGTPEIFCNTAAYEHANQTVHLLSFKS